jgi:putative NADH-flavin reductase
MNIAIIGATGRIGQRILNEAVSRGHNVTAFTSDPSKIPAQKGKVTWKTADALNPDSVSEAMKGQDVLISSYGPSMADPKQIPVTAKNIAAAAKSLLAAGEKNPAVRILVVGGAGSLEVAPGKTVIDAGMIPPEWLPIPVAHKEALDIFRANQTVNWTFFSPAAMINPGERTGKFRIGGDQLIVGENGKSEISMEDYAIAMLDEVENPKHIRQRFTIGY